MRRQTRCVVRHEDDSPGNPRFPGAVMPIDPSTAFLHIDDELQAYPRYFNTPNQAAVAQIIADLEGAEAGLVFASGMAAISTTLTALLPPGSHAIFLKGLYGGSQSLIASEMETRQVTYTLVNSNSQSFAAAIQPNTRVIYVESPTNPLLELVDLVALASLAREHDIITVIDNTFASPINQNPIKHGIDVVVHSGTKYLGGHSDLCCGAVASGHTLIERIAAKAKLYGGSLNALSVYLLDRSLKTLEVRVQGQTANAFVIAKHLERHPQVAAIHYPGLPAHPAHKLAQRQMLGGGAMLAFELGPGLAVLPFLQALRVIRPALSLGGVETSVCVPATTSHRDVPDEELASCGITPQLIRLSLGLEHPDDLKTDLDQAIEAAAAERSEPATAHSHPR